MRGSVRVAGGSRRRLRRLSDGEWRHDRAYPRIPQEALRQWTLPRGRPRCCPRKLSELRQGAAGHQSLLRRQSQSGAGNPETACRARLLFRCGLGAGNSRRARCRRTARAHLIRQHHQERDGDRSRLRARRHALCRRLRGRGRESRARRARQPGDLPHPLRRRGRRMAAVTQVRLRAGLRRRHSRTCAQARARAARRVFSRWLAAAQCRSLGPRARLDGGRVPRLRRARHSAVHRQSRRRLSGASISATTCRTPSWSRGAGSSATPA
jgi:hypothetical protein